LRELAYSHALIEDKISIGSGLDPASQAGRQADSQTVRRLWWMMSGVVGGRVLAFSFANTRRTKNGPCRIK